MVAGSSASVAVTVITAVEFSATRGVALDVNDGLLSLTGVTVTFKVWSVVRPAPSLARTVTTYTLSALASVGAS